MVLKAISGSSGSGGRGGREDNATASLALEEKRILRIQSLCPLEHLAVAQAHLLLPTALRGEHWLLGLQLGNPGREGQEEKGLEGFPSKQIQKW